MEITSPHPQYTRGTTLGSPLKWRRSEALALASAQCIKCQGVGLIPLKDRTRVEIGMRPCYCVLRQIFRLCYERFQEASFSIGVRPATPERLERGRGSGNKFVWGRKNEEYVADFILAAKRSLEAREYKCFTLHFILRGDWRICCKKMAIDRGNFFHMVYRVEEKLGRAFRELEPYSLFPLDEYFGGTCRGRCLDPAVAGFDEPLALPIADGAPLRAPLAA